MTGLQRRAALARMTKVQLIDYIEDARAMARIALDVVADSGDIGYASGALKAAARALGLDTDRENGSAENGVTDA